jgi:hypothetical protein
LDQPRDAHAGRPAEMAREGIYEPLTAEPTTEYRTREEQQPAPGRDELVEFVYENMPHH